MTEENKYPVLKIEMIEDIPSPQYVRIYLDGVDISGFTQNLRLEIGIDVMKAYLEVIVCPDIPKILLDKIEVEQSNEILFERKEVEREKKINSPTASDFHKKKMHVRPEPKTKPPTKR